MSIAACAELVRQGDPDRFRAAMAAPVAARARLFPLYAFNLEIARAPWVASEPLVAQMRLQFWRDVVAGIEAGEAPRAHEVAEPLAGVMRETGLPAALLDRLVVARWADAERAPMGTVAELDAYLGETGGTLMWAAALALGEDAAHEAMVRRVGKAAGLAMMLTAAPELNRRGWRVLPEEGLEAMIATARADLAAAHASRFTHAVPALRAAWRAGGILARAEADPAAIGEGRLEASEFSNRARLGWLSLTGRW